MIVLVALATGAKAATGYGVYIAGVEVTSSNYNKLANIDGVNVGTNGRIYYDSSDKTLYLKNVQILKKDKIGIWNKSVSDLKIVFEECIVGGVNKGSSVESTNNPAIQLDISTTFKSQGKGHGVIMCNSESASNNNYADLYVSLGYSVDFQNVDISFQGNNCYGIKAKGGSSLYIVDSSVEIWGGTEFPAIQTMGKLNIKGASTVTLKGNDDTETVSGLKNCTLTDMVITTPLGATFSASNQTFCYSNGQAIDGDIEFTTTVIPINKTNFTDNTFRTFISTFYDLDENGYLTAAERTNVKEFRTITNQGIQDLKGVEYFVDLETLDCSYNKISTLDLRKNTKLKILYCENNQLTSVYLSDNTLLEKLRCYNNLLTSLSLTSNSNLKELQCYNNKLTSLGLANNKQLSILDCRNNQLTSLNLTYNTKLERLICYGNNLTTITMGGSSYPYLNHVELDDINENKTISFDSHQTVVNKLPTVSSSVSAHFEPGYYISKADVTKAQNKGWRVGFSGLEAYKLTDIITDANFRYYVSSMSCCKFGWLIQNQANNISEMDVSGKSISNLTGINYFPGLWYLYCQNNSLTSLNVSSLTDLKELNCSGNKLTSLNVSSNILLDVLECQNNQLTSLTLPSESTSLYEVKCYGNRLKGSNMTNTVNSLPRREYYGGKFYFATSASTEGNEMDGAQLFIVEDKLWTAYYQNNNSTWVPYVYDGIATGMEAIDNARKAADDGTPQYNMQGQRVGNGYHGIVIRNGRKVLVK